MRWQIGVTHTWPYAKAMLTCIQAYITSRPCASVNTVGAYSTSPRSSTHGPAAGACMSLQPLAGQPAPQALASSCLTTTWLSRACNRQAHRAQQCSISDGR